MEPRNRSREESWTGSSLSSSPTQAPSGVQTQPGTNTAFAQRDLEGRGWGSRHLTLEACAWHVRLLQRIINCTTNQKRPFFVFLFLFLFHYSFPPNDMSPVPR